MKSSDYTGYPVNTSPWVMIAPVINNQHIRKEDDETLQDDCAERTGPGMAMLSIGAYLLDIDDLTEWEGFGYSDAFLHLLETFHHLGFHYLRLDPDGNVLDDLPRFEW